MYIICALGIDKLSWSLQIVDIGYSMLDTTWHRENICAAHEKLNNLLFIFSNSDTGEDRQKKQRKDNDEMEMTKLSPGSRDNEKIKDEQVINTEWYSLEYLIS